MARIHELLAQLRASAPALAADIEREIDVLADRRAFGLNFERHTPEAVELPGRRVRVGDKVRVLPPRGEMLTAANRELFRVASIERGDDGRGGTITPLGAEFEGSEAGDRTRTVAVDDLVVVAEFRDPIYPGLVSTGRVERGSGTLGDAGDKPYHSVINAENFHALQTLLFTHRGQVDAIYIDPPYNSGARDWKYNNDYVESDDLYRHSKWLAMMERRLLLAKELLDPNDSVLIVTIDEKEYLRLGLLLSQVFPDARITMVTSSINKGGVPRKGTFGRSAEYLYFAMFGDARPWPQELPDEWNPVETNNKFILRWRLMRRDGQGASRSDAPNNFYPIYIRQVEGGAIFAGVGETYFGNDPKPEPPLDDTIAVWPIRKDGSEGRWQNGPAKARELIKSGYAKIGPWKGPDTALYYLNEGERAKVEKGQFPVRGHDVDGSVITGASETEMTLVPSDIWRISSHDAGNGGSRLLGEMIPSRKFPFPKSLYAVEDALRFFVSNNPRATIVDFFSGSGTTAHSVMRLNKQDGGRRVSISVTNNEVGVDEQANLRKRDLRPGDSDWECWGICDYITKPRIRAAIEGTTPEGHPIKGEYKFTDVFPIADGLHENVEFFTLTYESPMRVQSNREFARIAPFLWMRAGSRGRRIDSLANGWDVAEAYGVLEDLDRTDEFLAALRATPNASLACIVTDEDRLFEAVVRDLPTGVEPVRLYQSYLSNFEIDAMRSAR